MTANHVTGGPAILMDGRALAETMLAEVARQVAELTAVGTSPGLAIVQVGEEPTSRSYVCAIQRTCRRVGILDVLRCLPIDVAPDRFGQELEALANDETISGIIVQLPLPPWLQHALRRHLSPEKDVDGIHPTNAGLLAIGDPAAFVPATPLGGMELLRHYGVDLEGQRAVVVGRSAIVGRPMASLLLQANATVTICHSRTVDLPAVTRAAQVLVVATGHPAMITAEMVSPGACVIDFGINFVGGRMVGDVDTDAVAQVARYITPVPGGTGPMTNVMLMQNTLRAAREQRHNV